MEVQLVLSAHPRPQLSMASCLGYLWWALTLLSRTYPDMQAFTESILQCQWGGWQWQVSSSPTPRRKHTSPW
jgi:hypothetical protein